MDALAVSYVGELIRFGVDTAIAVPGAFTPGTNHFINAGAPADGPRAAEYDSRYGSFMKELPEHLAALTPRDADAQHVADAIATVINLPHGERPLRATSIRAATAAKSSPPWRTAFASSSSAAPAWTTSSLPAQAADPSLPTTHHQKGPATCRLRI
jgi:hypothetical protein